MTGDEHYQQAEAALRAADRNRNTRLADQQIAVAQVHATLALAALPSLRWATGYAEDAS